MQAREVSCYWNKYSFWSEFSSDMVLPLIFPFLYYQALNLDIGSYEEKVIEIKQTAGTLKEEENFLAEDMIDKTDSVYER